MARLPKARYTREFKVHAVRMSKDEGLGIAETAHRLSISTKTIANWVKLAQEGQDFAKPSAAGDVDAKNSRLRKENARLRMECEILKKVAAYCAKESRRDTPLSGICDSVIRSGLPVGYCVFPQAVIIPGTSTPSRVTMQTAWSQGQTLIRQCSHEIVQVLILWYTSLVFTREKPVPAAAQRRHDVSDAVWKKIEPHLPGREGSWGGIAHDNRRFIDAVFWIMRTGVPWRDLPPTSATGATPIGALFAGVTMACGNNCLKY
jgi:Transposase and inactivated derivatives